MSRWSALSFAEAGSFTQVRAFAGDVLYTEAMPALHGYVVKEGEVDLYLVRDEKRTVVETLGPGQCFGFEPHLEQPVRLHCAAARGYCELFVVDNTTAARALAAGSDLLQGMLVTAAQRLAAAHELIARRVSYQPELLAYAQMLHLAGLAELAEHAAPQRSAARGRGSAATVEPELARPLLQAVVNHARVLFGHSDRHIRACLRRLTHLHLIRIDEGSGTGKQVVFAPREIVAQARKAVADDPDQRKQVHQYLSLDEFGALVEVDRGVLLRKLAAGELAEDVFTFRRDEILRVLDRHGRRYFAERKIKPPSEFTEIDDLEFADARAVFDAVSRMDTLDIARLLRSLDDGEPRRRLLGSLSARRRKDVESDLEGMGVPDATEARRLGQSLIAQVKDAMLKKAA